MPRRPAAVLVPERPLTLRDIRIVRLDQNSSIDLRTRQVNHPSAETTVDIDRGVPSQNPLTSTMMLRTVVPPDES